MKNIKVIALTHKKADLTTIGRFHIEESQQAARLSEIQQQLGWSELMFLSTCNRVEVIFVTEDKVNDELKTAIITGFIPELDNSEVNTILPQLEVYQGTDAVRHLFEVASSLDSMVIGEREIITQFRKAYENCNKAGLTGDKIRLVAAQTIETAKRIFTETQLCTRPVSVVSLAFKALMDSHVQPGARILMIGAGTTNRNMARFLTKAGHKNLHIFNRTLANAELMVKEVGGVAHSLSELESYTGGFDVIVTCTGSANAVLTTELYQHLSQGELDQKIVIDLAIPADFDPAISSIFPVKLINVASLKPISEANLKAREKEMVVCVDILDECLVKFNSLARERKVELAMKSVPKMVKDIKERAIQEVFAKDLAKMDDETRAVLERMMEYVEKKYISGPIKLAKEIMLAETH
ncbi:MAG: glutamyl-tRNA reductase [Bacteroidota bacterium]